MNIKEMDQTYIANTYNRFPLAIVKGKGAVVYDEEGKAYIDLGSGIAVNIFGVQDDVWKEAVAAQMNQIQHMSNLYYTVPQVKLAELLCEKTGFSKVFFGNSGAEANECAIKVARKYASDKYGEGKRPTIITLQNSFHGRTITTLSATGQETFHHHFVPFTPGFMFVPANDYAAMEQAVQQNEVCGILVELVQGEGGINVLEKDYVKQVASLCEKHDMLFMVDEVQTGNGRTGTLYAYEQYGVMPDVLTTAKGLGGGLPIGACLIGEKAKDTLSAGTHASTFGGNPICAAGALSILKRIDAALLEDVKKKHDYIMSELSGQKGIEGIYGLGLILGVKTKKSVADVIKGCMQKGVLVLSAKDKVRLLPPLTITMEELKKALAVLKEVAAT